MSHSKMKPIQTYLTNSCNIEQLCYTCNECHCVHATAGENKQHREDNHGEKTETAEIKLRKVFLCEYCEECFADAESLYVHRDLKPWNNQDEITYTCKICKNEFSTYFKLAAHKATHNFNSSGIKLQSEASDDNTPQNELTIPKLFCCEICDRTFPRFVVYWFHKKKTKHSYTMKDSSYENLNARKLVRIPNYQCIVCKNKFISEKSLEKHSKIHRDGGIRRIYVCVYCRKHFSSRVAYKFHRNTHRFNTL